MRLKIPKHEEYIDGEFNSHFSTSLFNIEESKIKKKITNIK